MTDSLTILKTIFNFDQFRGDQEKIVNSAIGGENALVLMRTGVGIALYYGIDFLSNMPCPPPVRPTNVPVTASWAGSCDGGSWIVLEDVSIDKHLHFKIYHGNNGEIRKEGTFYPDQHCKSLEMTAQNITSNLSF